MLFKAEIRTMAHIYLYNLIENKTQPPFAGTSDQNRISTLTMVIILTVIVKCVFISFATLAVCYR